MFFLTSVSNKNSLFLSACKNCYTKCNYKIGQICEVIFYQDDENNCCIAIVMELFFEEVMIKKNEQIGLICSYVWY